MGKCEPSHGLRGLSSGPISCIKYHYTSIHCGTRSRPAHASALEIEGALMGVAMAVGLACTDNV